MTDEQKDFYQRGFQMAINYFYYALDDAEEKEKFRELVEKGIVSDKVEASDFLDTSLAIRNSVISPSGQQCGAGYCWDDLSGSCVRCRFDFAFDGDHFVA